MMRVFGFSCALCLRLFPFSPPPQLYHPNINLVGNICLNILRDDWRPILNIQNVIHGLIFLFLDPNPDDPLNRTD
jgi:ubiquitin-conjugating enzyme E2 M